MRIVINDIAASSGGALSILKSFYKYLIDSKEHKEHEWIFLLSGNYIEETENIKVIILRKVKENWFNRLKFELYSGKGIISKLNPDVVLSLQNTMTIGLDCPQVIYMHQSIPFQTEKKFSFLKSEERIFAVYQYVIGRIIKKSIEKADKTIVQTNWIRNAVIEMTNVNPDKITAILPPYETTTDINIRESLLDSNSFFYPAANNLYKNHKCIYEACSILNKKGTEEYRVLLTINEESNKENIFNIGNIPFEKVISLYKKTTLIFPSYIETVGLPLMEAKKLGALILVADCKYSREVLDGYNNAYYFDPFNPRELADLMEKVLSKEIKIKYNEQIINNKKKTSSNSWNDVIKILIESNVK